MTTSAPMVVVFRMGRKKHRLRAAIHYNGDLIIEAGQDPNATAHLTAHAAPSPGLYANLLRSYGESIIEQFPGSRWVGEPPPASDGPPWEGDPS